MEEKPKSIWRKSFTGRVALVIWAGVATFAIILGSYIPALANYSYPLSDWVASASIIGGLCFLGFVMAIYIVWPLLRLLLWKHWRRTLFVSFCLATLITLFYAEENWRGKRAWDNFRREWTAKGEKFDFKDFVPPPVPDDQNFAMTTLVVDSIKYQYGSNVARQWYGVDLTEAERTNLINRWNLETYAADDSESRPKSGFWDRGTRIDLMAWQNYYRQLATRTNLFAIPPQPRSPAQDVLLALNKYDSAVAELRMASQLPYSRFPVFPDTENTFAILLPHLSNLKRSAQFLALRACAELQNGESEPALADTKLMIELGEKIRNEPFIISHLVRIAMLNLTLQPIFEGLADHRWSDIQLGEFDKELSKLNFLGDYEASMRGERAGCISALKYMQRTRDMDMLGQIDSKRPQITWARWLIPDAFFSQNALTVARIHQAFVLPVINAPSHSVSPASVQRLQAAVDKELNNRSFPYKIFARMLLPAIKNTVQKYVRGQSSVDLARTAIALERYRLAHGEFPESLAALEPQFIAQLPHDVIGGGPLKYRREADGTFTLYSIGWNEKDDGGVTVYQKGHGSPDFESGDWVWRYPKK